eukprot:1707270-Rhodomonas_salina.2
MKVLLSRMVLPASTNGVAAVEGEKLTRRVVFRRCGCRMNRTLRVWGSRKGTGGSDDDELVQEPLKLDPLDGLQDPDSLELLAHPNDPQPLLTNSRARHAHDLSGISAVVVCQTFAQLRTARRAATPSSACASTQNSARGQSLAHRSTISGLLQQITAKFSEKVVLR